MTFNSAKLAKNLPTHDQNSPQDARFATLNRCGNLFSKQAEGRKFNFLFVFNTLLKCRKGLVTLSLRCKSLPTTGRKTPVTPGSLGLTPGWNGVEWGDMGSPRGGVERKIGVAGKFGNRVIERHNKEAQSFTGENTYGYRRIA